MTITYLAEPIDFANGRPSELAGQLAEKLAALGHSVYRPAAAWLAATSQTEHGGAVIAVNNGALDRCDLLVAYLPSDTRSVGVPMEIERATGRGIPVVVVTDLRGSAMLDANPLVVTIQDSTGLEWAVREAKRRSRWVPSEGCRRELPVQVDPGHAGLVRHYATDAGLDMHTTQTARVAPGETAMLMCGVRAELPSDVFALITARSSTFARHGIMVPPSIIDTGYRGELGVPVYRLPHWDGDTVIEAGTRLGQVVLLPNLTSEFDPTRVSRVADADRGTNGFGSTGH